MPTCGRPLVDRYDLEDFEQLALASILFEAGERINGCPSGLRLSGLETMRVGFLLAPDFTLLAFSGFIETLRQLSDDGRRVNKHICQWEILANDSQLIISSCGVSVAPTQMYDDPRQFDYIVLVGGQLPTRMPLSSAAISYLRKADSAGVPLIGLCTASFHLARAGLMTGRKACVHWFHHREFVDEFPDITPVADKIFVDDGDRITCAGGTFTIDLAVHLINRHCDRRHTARALSMMGVEFARSENYTQTPHFEGLERLTDKRVRAAVQMLERQLNDPPRVQEIAAKLNISVRQLERSFIDTFGVGPAELSRLLRLRYGRWLVENSNRPITTIALDCGFADGAHFTRHFRKRFGSKPSDLRQARNRLS